MLWYENKSKSRKHALAAFRFETGHECLLRHLHQFSILHSDNCTVRHADSTHSDGLSPFETSVALKDNESRDMTALYWDS